MDDVPHTQAGTEVPPAAPHDASAGLVDVAPAMLGWTWAAFIILAFGLYKVAWKPILKALDQRERSIRQALEQAEQARGEAATTEARNRELLQAAERDAQRLVAEARAAAQEAGRQVREEAGRQARQLVADARREIETATEQARLQLRRETAGLAIALAGKVVARNMDTDRNRDMVRDFMKELESA